MVASVWGMCVEGLKAHFVRVEVDIANGLPAFEIVGLPTTAVREARERVRAAIRNCGFSFPMQRITVNLAPADVRKEGSGLDLAIATGILAALGHLSTDLEGYVLSGELSLEGRVRPVTGILTLALALRQDRQEEGLKTLVVAWENLPEARLIEEVPCCGVTTLSELVEVLNKGHRQAEDSGCDILWQEDNCDARLKVGASELVRGCGWPDRLGLGEQKGADGGPRTQDGERDTGAAREDEPDFRHIHGHKQVKRALEVAAAGGHNILMIGPPGVGKTLMAKAFAGILPPMCREECLQVTQIYSLAGLLAVPVQNRGHSQSQGYSQKDPLIRRRPFRSPHHTATLAAMMGGGQKVLPGEVALADHGVLFLDEMPEFSREVLEALRQPLEEGVVHITRQKWKADFPARLSLIATMNPCPCGYFGDSSRACRCSPNQIKHYRGRISGPLLDRFDIHIEVSSLSYDELHGPNGEEPSAAIAQRVAAARFRQQERLQDTGLSEGVLTNARMSSAVMRGMCQLDTLSQRLLKRVYEGNKLSARGHDRVLRVARSIADLAQQKDIGPEHIAEALSYRVLDSVDA